MAKKNKKATAGANEKQGVTMLAKIKEGLPSGWIATNKTEAYQKDLRKTDSFNNEVVWTSWAQNTETGEKGLAILGGKVSVIPAAKFGGYTLNGHELK